MIAAIVAQARDRVIGNANDMPWYLPADLAHFKALTTGHTVIMGRKTFESIFARLGKPLPNRQNIVVTRNTSFSVDGAETAFSLEAAITLAKNETVFIIGGAQIYAQALPLVDTIYLTRIDADIEGDSFFPELSETDWRETKVEKHTKDAKNSYDYAFITLFRK